MKGEARSAPNHSAALSSRTIGATGRKSSRSLMSLRRCCIEGSMGEARIDRAPIARCRLHPDAFEGPPFEESRVHDAVKGDAARKAEVAGAGPLVQPAGNSEHCLFEHDLQRGGDIEMPRFESRLPLSGRPEHVDE